MTPTDQHSTPDLDDCQGEGSECYVHGDACAPSLSAWVNWNPEPDIHTLDRVMRRGTAIATCGVTVRIQLPDPFDPTHPKACEDCAAERRRPIDLSNAIVCGRTDVQF